MSNIRRRIDQVEKALGLEGSPVVIPILSIALAPKAPDDDTVPRFPEPVEMWASYRSAVEQSVRSRMPCLFIANPFREYEVRHKLPEGSLSTHPLAGKVSFETLLGLITNDKESK
jgi:hypothetical protein